MKKYSWILVVAAMAPLFPLACGGGTTGTTSTGSGGGSGGGTTTSTTTGHMTTTTGGTTTTTTGGTTTTSGSTGSGGAPDCSGILNPNACATCLEASCCAELAACNDAACIACSNGDMTMCDATNQAMGDALGACKDTSCKTECTAPPPVDPTCSTPTPSPSNGACVTLSAKIKCNPVTNAPCNTAMGEACDVTADGYDCYPAPNKQDLCQPCGTKADGFCKGGETCGGVGNTCAKFCCDDADCGAGKCDKSAMSTGGVGLCAGGNGGTTSSSSASSSSASSSSTSSSSAASSSSTGP